MKDIIRKKIQKIRLIDVFWMRNLGRLGLCCVNWSFRCDADLFVFEWGEVGVRDSLSQKIQKFFETVSSC